MDWEELIQAVPTAEVFGADRPDITGIAYDSRQVQPGNLFVCIEGSRVDGHDYIDEALSRGAVAVVVTKPVPLSPRLPSLLVSDSRKALGVLAQRFYQDPTAHLTLVGITGTNGKTTSTYMLKSILEAAGHRVGLLGTIAVVIGDVQIPAQRTTAESLDFLQLIDQMRNQQITHVVAEVSSHAIALDRIVGSRYAYGLLTNVTLDHLDFHKTFDEYLKTKASFFSQLGQGAAVNYDDEHRTSFIDSSNVPVITYGLKEGADVRAHHIYSTNRGTHFDVEYQRKTVPVEIPLVGDFNVYNALGVFAIALQMSIEPRAITKGLAQVPKVPGRFESVEAGQDFLVIVDYAHTPDGLENVLLTARGLVREHQGRVICVFGCGGDRDKTKRPQMGQVAAKLADYVVITSDNPRSEEPERICQDIEQGIKETGVPPLGYQRITDRLCAIKHAISVAEPGDLVLIAGKGHETYQIFKDKTIDFDDRLAARRALGERGYDKWSIQ
ncbi:MAG: UDP-N-acetylmuramoyl-L-alanyl-D-glutamate--2,6-diaminopimelate ligase [Limnochordia bacterium]|jgi:UDP-N-acetylmuramoyl-L-alanyl-D-glutamate--2,6-diaminopimelate ligase|nr:UDP-N-acetylmuramoyl-L-alanyl-D-glutamate--2,6-diaminopimelate ligase [Limnochordia bacterium]MDD4517661.1 UDP-N-acetylmuramoyl-L-alanyl-D-glutamate--2,6-diaminopimelate ligase [Limnochordia bacterium]